MNETAYDYSQYCAYRLPCGICTRTNAQCPLNYGRIEITCRNDGTNFTVNSNGTEERKDE